MKLATILLWAAAAVISTSAPVEAESQAVKIYYGTNIVPSWKASTTALERVRRAGITLKRVGRHWNSLKARDMKNYPAHFTRATDRVTAAVKVDAFYDKAFACLKKQNMRKKYKQVAFVKAMAEVRACIEQKPVPTTKAPKTVDDITDDGDDDPIDVTPDDTDDDQDDDKNDDNDDITTTASPNTVSPTVMPVTEFPQPTYTNAPMPEPTYTNAPMPEPTYTNAPMPEPTYTNAPMPEPTYTNAPMPEPTYTNAPMPEPTYTDAPMPQPTYTDAPMPQPTYTDAPMPEPTYTDAPMPQPTYTDAPMPEPTYTNAPMPEPTETDAPLPVPTDEPITFIPHEITDEPETWTPATFAPTYAPTDGPVIITEEPTMWPITDEPVPSFFYNPASRDVPPFYALDFNRNHEVSPEEWKEYISRLRDVAFSTIIKGQDAVAVDLLRSITDFHYSVLSTCIHDRLASLGYPSFETGAAYEGFSNWVQDHCYVKYRFSLLSGPPPFEWIAKSSPVITAADIEAWFTHRLQIAKNDLAERKVTDVSPDQLESSAGIVKCTYEVLLNAGATPIDRNAYYQILGRIEKCATASRI